MIYRISLFSSDVSHLSNEGVNKHFLPICGDSSFTFFLFLVSPEEETLVILTGPVRGFFSLMVSASYRNWSTPKSARPSPRFSHSHLSDLSPSFLYMFWGVRVQLCFFPHSYPAESAPFTEKIVFLFFLNISWGAPVPFYFYSVATVAV